MQDARSPSAQLVGAWRLLSLDTPDSASRGPDAPAADGLILYDAAGYMSAQILSPNAGEGPMAFHSYFGTYTVDEAAATITHHRIVNSAPGAPRDVVRSYRFASEDVIVLSIHGHAGTELTFERARR